MILVENLTFRYPDGTPAIQEVNIHAEQGQTIALVGANGAGKSTLLSLLVGLYPIQNGLIQINGIKLTKCNYNEIRRLVGLVFQNPDDQLFMPKIFDDVAFGLRNQGKSEAEVASIVGNVLEEFQITHLKDRSSHRLSGGEKKIATLAAVMAMEPKVLLLDEPTAFLDPRSRRHLIRTLSEIRQTKVIATHDLDLAMELCQKTVILKHGRVFETGDPNQLFQSESLMKSADLELPVSLQKTMR